MGRETTANCAESSPQESLCMRMHISKISEDDEKNKFLLSKYSREESGEVCEVVWSTLLLEFDGCRVGDAVLRIHAGCVLGLEVLHTLENQRHDVSVGAPQMALSSMVLNAL